MTHFHINASAIAPLQHLGPRLDIDALRRRVQSAGSDDGYATGETGKFFDALGRAFGREPQDPIAIERFEQMEIYPADKCCLWALDGLKSAHIGSIPTLESSEWNLRAVVASLLLLGWWREQRGMMNEWLPLGIVAQACVVAPELALPFSRQVEWGWRSRGGHASRDGADMLARAAARVVLACIAQPEAIRARLDDARRAALWLYEERLSSRSTHHGAARVSPADDGLRSWSLGEWEDCWPPVERDDWLMDAVELWRPVWRRLAEREPGQALAIEGIAGAMHMAM